MESAVVVPVSSTSVRMVVSDSVLLQELRYIPAAKKADKTKLPEIFSRKFMADSLFITQYGNYNKLSAALD